MDKAEFNLAVQQRFEREAAESGLASVSTFDLTRFAQLAGKVAAEIHEEEKS